MSDIIFKTEFKTGAKGDQGNAGTSFEVPTGAIMGFDGSTVPEGFEETDPPSGAGLLKVDLTQAQYDMLSQEQKEDEGNIYFITPAVLYNWDFTVSAIDTIQGEEAVLNGGVTRDSNGAYVDTAGQITISADLIGKALEIQFGSITALEAIGKIMTSDGDSDYGIGISGTQLYALYNGEWQGVPFTDNFSDSTLYILFPDENNMKIYYNDSLIYDGITFIKSGATYFTIGFNEGCTHPLLVKTVTITE